MKRIPIYFLLLFLTGIANAQSFTNEWLKSDQDYIKIPVEETGFYKVSFADLITVLPTLKETPSSKVELWYQGKKVAFELQSLDSKIDETDVLFFYGLKNDGKFESELYRPRNAQSHNFSSLYSDQSIYYLSFSSNQENQKFIEKEVSAFEIPLTKLETQNFETLQVFNNEFTFNSVTGPIPLIQHSYFEFGEGYTGTMIRANSPNIQEINLDGIVSKSIQLDIMLNGRDSNIRKIRIETASIDTTVALAGFGTRLVRLRPVLKDLLSTKLPIKISSADDRFSINYLKASFEKDLNIKDTFGKIYLRSSRNSKIEYLNNNSKPHRLFNISDPFNLKEAKLNSEGFILNSIVANPIYAYVNEPKTISKYSLLKLEHETLKNTANYLIVSSKKLKQASRLYAEYRRSDIGGKHSVELVFVEDLYDQFNFGVKSPLAIMNYLRFKLSQGNAKYLLLIGKAFSAYTGKNDSTDLVPSIGYPASDALLSAGILTHEDVAGLATGRIPALTNKEVLIYLDKIKAQQALDPTIDRKNMLHFNGGKTFTEIETFGSIMDSYQALVKDNNYGTKFYSFRKKTLDPREPANLVESINEGVTFMSFLGHSSYQTIDLNIGFASDVSLGYQNKRFPVMLINGCAFNNYFREIPTISQDWLFSENKGALAIIGQSYFGYLNALQKHTSFFYKNAFLSETELSLGEILKLSSEQVVNEKNYGAVDVLNNHQTLLFGDPALKLFGFTKPDYSISEAKIITESPQVKYVQVVINNAGKVENTTLYNLKMTQIGLPENKTTTYTLAPTKFIDTLKIPYQALAFEENVKIEIDFDNLIPEENETNNVKNLDFTQSTQNKDNLAPFLTVNIDQKGLYENVVVSTNPRVSFFINDNFALSKNDDPNKNLIVFLKKCKSCLFEKLNFNDIKWQRSQLDTNSILIEILLPNLPEEKYEIIAVAKDDAGNSSTLNPIRFDFQIKYASDSDQKELLVYPNPASECVKFIIPELGSNESGTINYEIFNSIGDFINSWKEPIVPGINSSIFCKNTKGIYLYKILINSNKSQQTFTGKIIITN